MLRRHPVQLEIPVTLYPLLESAAALEGQTIEEFVVKALRQAAEAVVPVGDVVPLSKVDQEVFAQALLNPAPPNVALSRAFSRSKKLFG